MKKVLSSILISLIIFVNLFAPISAGINGKKIEIKKNEVSAEVGVQGPVVSDFDLNIEAKVSSTDTTTVVEITMPKDSEFQSSGFGTINDVYLYITLTDVSGKIIENISENPLKQHFMRDWGADQDAIKAVEEGRPLIFNFSKLTANLNYKVKIELGKSTFIPGAGGGNTSSGLIATTGVDIKTNETGNTDVVAQGETTIKTTDGGGSKDMPECGLATPMGCVAQFFYYVFFVPTSYLFALAGTFFDSTFAYSVQDNSYRSVFVVQGWGLVRDFCNLFFIFILLYVAIGTILSLHSMKTKETIINVVIIGLFINFSLFATQVIIDASNITARVFYNSDTIKLEEEGANGVAKATPGLTIREDGVIPMSAGIVNKVNPQNIILQSKKINNVPDKGAASSTDTTNTDEDKGNLSISSFILITLIASAVNIVGFIVFLSVGMMFVARIVGLWIAMILAPLAFFTYILPEQMAGIKMIGWKNWWPETFKLAFLAPVFMFFMYIILKFLSMDLISDIAGKSLTQDGLGYFISILMPFAFIMVLLVKAKGIAKDMSGELGQQITGGVAAAGGMLLGGAALGTAFLGRRTIGAGIAKLSRSEDAIKRANHKVEFNKEVDHWKASGGIGVKPTWEGYKQANNITTKEDVFTRLGSKLNEKQAKVNVLDHATHEIEEAKKTAHIVDSKGETLDDSNMSGQDEIELEKAFNKNKKADVESNMRKGLDASGKKPAYISDSTGNQYEGEEAYKKAKRGEIEAAYIADPSNNVTSVNDLTDKDKKNIENALNKQFNVDLSEATKNELEGFFKHIREESRQGVSMLTRGFARSNKASYDFRNLSEIKAGKKDSFMSKIPTAMIAGVALGVRTGLKNSGVNHGQGQADFLKDISSTLIEALKGIKVEVPKAPSGGGGGHDAHGGGGGHH